MIKNAVPVDRAVSYQEKAYAWLKSFGTDLDFKNPTTWIKQNLPVQSRINTFNSYSVAHEKFMWDTRLEPRVLEIFSELWGTDELLASFDALNVTFPNRVDVPRKPAWEHVDQSPFRRGMHCMQGIVNLSPSGPNDGGLVVYPGSHKFYDEFFDTQTNAADWSHKDIYHFRPEHLEWFRSHGLAPKKVCAEVGDLLIWDSRTVHYGSEPTELSTQIRTVVYVSYAPARLASEQQLALKKRAFEKHVATTHWPHDNIVPKENVTYLEDGTRAFNKSAVA